MILASILLSSACNCNHPSLKQELCTSENVVKALELAKEYLDIDTGNDFFDGNSITFTAGDLTSSAIMYSAGTGTWRRVDGDEEKVSPNPNIRSKRSDARKLEKEADDLEQKDKDLQFILDVLKACKD